MPLLLLLLLPTADAEKLGIAVLDPKTSAEVAADVGPVVSGLMSSRLDKTGVFRVVTQDDVRQMIDFDQMKTALACDEQASCLSEIGQALGVPYLLTSNLAKLGDVYVLNLTLIDIEHAKVERRETQTYADLGALTRELDAHVDKTVQALLYREQGDLVLSAEGGEEAGAVVEVDGVAIGALPLGPQRMSAGPHRVRVSKDGFFAFVKDVVVPPQKQAPLTIELKPLQPAAPPAEPFPWGPTGAVVGGVSFGVLVAGHVLLSFVPVGASAPGEITRAVLIPVVGPFLAAASIQGEGGDVAFFLVFSLVCGAVESALALGSVVGGALWAWDAATPVDGAALFWRWGLVGGGAVALASGLAIDTLSPTSSNRAFDIVDAVPPVLYVAGVAAPIVGLAVNPFAAAAEEQAAAE